MTASAPWTVDRDLPVGVRVLLEASAGTGKTYAIEGLVARLVAEHDVPIDRILVITFTKAATAELRDRVRRRLTLTRDALERGVAEDEPDDLLRRLCAPPEEREERRRRVQRALTDFDRAPISTIHGFCQRTLQQLAFESGQEPDLDVLGDAADVRDELVADALADVYHRATEGEVALLAEMGFTRATLGEVVAAMTGPVEPRVVPAVSPDDPGCTDPLHAARTRWPGALDAFRGWLASPAGAASWAALVEEPRRPSKSARKGKPPYCRVPRMPKDLDVWLEGWLEGGGGRQQRLGSSRAKWATPAHLEERWDAVEGPFDTFAGAEAAARVQALFDAQDAAWSAPLAGFAVGVRARFEREIERRAQLTYDGMLSRLAERLLQEPEPGVLAAAIRARYEVALVDEFQDTDAAQWTVLQRVFGVPDRRLFVIGDPKQSIYGFRNADLHVYHRAADGADRFHLARNHRSDQPLVHALNALWGGHPEPFGAAGIDWQDVDAAAGLRIDGLPPLDGRPRRALELRWFDGAALHREPDASATKADVVDLCVRACAAECRALLEGGTRVERRGVMEPLRPGDVAVLVATNRQARLVRDALASHGIPAVTGGRGSIFASEAVGWLCAWLDAVASPTSEGPARTLAVTPLIGWTAGRLARGLSAPRTPGAGTAGPTGGPGSAEEANDASPVSGSNDANGAADTDRADWERLRAHIATWAVLWPRQGFARVLDTALERHGAIERLLGSVHGERGATDVRHLAELCHAEERRTRVGPRGLAEWLRVHGQQADDGSDEQAIRLESDANAVQIVTVHKSKGLQYGVTLLPFAWEGRRSGGAGPLRVRLSDGEGAPVLALNVEVPGAPGRAEAEAQARQETLDEGMRLLYVAMTRARHHVVAWLGSYNPKQPGPLTRLVTGHGAGADADDDAPIHARALPALDGIAEASGDHMGWSAQAPLRRPDPSAPWRPGEAQALTIAALPFPSDRPLGALWQVASYSSLAKGRAIDLDDPSGRLPEATAGMDATGAAPAESARHAGLGAAWATLDGGIQLTGALADPALLRPAAGAALPGGTTTGDWIHEVFELLDFGDAAGTLGAARPGASPGGGEEDGAALVARLGRRHGTPDPSHHDEARRLLPLWLDTPLDAPLPAGGPLPALGGFTLRSLAGAGRRHRLDELGFDLRLGAGVRWAPSLRRGPGDATGRIDPEAVRAALADALGDHPQAAFGARGWVQALLALPGPSPDEARRLLPSIAGLLTGFIDLTFRVGGAGADGVYFVADYKTNAVRGPASLAPLVADALEAAGVDEARRLLRLHYARPVLAWEMGHAAYHLQALVYTVALHRMLAQRLGGAYDYDRHVGGHVYLFLKGMEGPATPRVDGAPLGVWADRWPRRTVVGLDQALDGATADAVRAAMDASDALRGGGR